MPIQVNHLSSGYLEALGNAFADLGQRERYEVDRVRRDQLSEAEAQRDLRERLANQELQFRRDNAQSGYDLRRDLTEMELANRERLANIERESWMDANMLKYRPELDLTQGMDRDLQRKLQKGEVQYSPQQLREIGQIQEAWDKVRRSNKYSGEEKAQAVQKLRRRLASIQPSRSIVPQSPYPEGQREGDVWQLEGPTGPTGVWLTRDEKGNVKSIHTQDIPDMVSKAADLAMMEEDGRKKLDQNIFNQMMSLMGASNFLIPEGMGGDGDGAPSLGDLVQSTGLGTMGTPPGGNAPMPQQTPPPQIPLGGYGYVPSMPKELSVAPKQGRPAQPRDMQSVLRDIQSGDLKTDSREFRKYLEKLTQEETIQLAERLKLMGVI